MFQCHKLINKDRSDLLKNIETFLKMPELEESEMCVFAVLNYDDSGEAKEKSSNRHGCQTAKFDPILSLDCAGVKRAGSTIQGKEGIKFCTVA